MVAVRTAHQGEAVFDGPVVAFLAVAVPPVVDLHAVDDAFLPVLFMLGIDHGLVRGLAAPVRVVPGHEGALLPGHPHGGVGALRLPVLARGVHRCADGVVVVDEQDVHVPGRHDLAGDFTAVDNEDALVPGVFLHHPEGGVPVHLFRVEGAVEGIFLKPGVHMVRDAEDVDPFPHALVDAGGRPDGAVGKGRVDVHVALEGDESRDVRDGHFVAHLCGKGDGRGKEGSGEEDSFHGYRIISAKIVFSAELSKISVPAEERGEDGGNLAAFEQETVVAEVRGEGMAHGSGNQGGIGFRLFRREQSV